MAAINYLKYIGVFLSFRKMFMQLMFLVSIGGCGFNVCHTYTSSCLVCESMNLKTNSPDILPDFPPSIVLHL